MCGNHALGRLYELQRNRVFAVCFAMLRDPDDAEDAVQETFLRIAAVVDTLRGDATGYLVTVARNVCRDELRRRAVRSAALPREVDAARTAEVSAEDSVIARRNLASALEHLSHEERTVFACTASGLTLAETAQRMGISASLAAQRIFRARQRLRRLMPNPALVGWMQPREMLDALSRRLQNRSTEVLLPLVSRFQEVERGVAPVVLGVLVGTGAAAASLAAAPHHAPPVAVAVPAAAHAGAVAPLQVRRALPVRVAAPHVAAPPPVDVPALDLQSFTPAPNYQRDHTIYATSAPSSSCSSGCTASLYRTADGGRTWQQLATVPAQDRILLPPSYPNDRTIFLAGAGGLLRSDDGGRSFATTGRWVCSSVDDTLAHPLPSPAPLPAVAPPQPQSCQYGVSAAAVDPDSRPGDTRIYMLTNPSQGDIPVYDSASGDIETGTSTPGSVTALFTAPQTHGVYAMNGGNQGGGGALYHCTDSCTQIGSVPSGRSGYTISQTFGADETFFYAIDWGQHPGVDVVTAAGGESYVEAPTGWSPVAVLPDSDYATSRTFDAIAMRNTSPHDLTLMRAAGGGPLQLRTGVALPDMLDFGSVVRMPDGHLFATLMSWAGDHGILCSADDGVHWARYCS